MYELNTNSIKNLENNSVIKVNKSGSDKSLTSIHLGWYKKADHPKNPGDQDPVDNISTYEIINYVNDVSLDNAQVLMTSDKNGDYNNAYTYGLERISVDNLASDEIGKRDPLYYLNNGRGSVAQLTNSRGQVRDSYSYDTFGVVNHSGPLGNSKTHYENFYGYNGEDHNRISGLQYLRARYYDPDT